MATKKRVNRSTEILELDKTLVVDDVIYNVNAVHSDTADNATKATHALDADRAIEAAHAKEADHSLAADTALLAGEASKVSKKLTINSTSYNGSTAIEFDGGEEKSINIVPTEGGSFNGRITVPSVDNDVLAANNDTVINYSDIVTKVVDKLINTSTMATWNNSTKKLTFTHDTPSVNGICVVTGPGANDGVLNFATANKKAKWLSDYIYICTDSGNIYLGASDSNTVLQLATKVLQLVDANDSSKYYDYVSVNDMAIKLNKASDDISALNAAVGILNNTTGTTSGNLTDLIKTVNTNKDNITKIIDGTTTVAKAVDATKATTADSATKATQDSSGNIISNYYQKKITLSSNAPSGGSNGDIWIRY